MEIKEIMKLKPSKMVSGYYEDGVIVADVNYIYKSVFDRLPKRAREILRNSGFEIKPDPIKIEV